MQLPAVNADTPQRAASNVGHKLFVTAGWHEGSDLGIEGML